MYITASMRWLLCAICVLMVALLAMLSGWTFPVSAFAVVTVCAISFFISEVVPGTLVAMLLPVAYIVFNVGRPAQVLSPWTMSVIWLVLGGVFISKMMEKSGVSKRMALWALCLCGASLRRLLWGILLSGFLIAPFVPTAMGKAALFMVILNGVCATLGFKKGSRETTCLFLCGILALAEPKFLFFTSSIDSALLMNIAKQHGLNITWLEYFYFNAVPGIVYAILCTSILCFFVPNHAKDLKKFVEEQYRSLGPLDVQEKKGIAILGIIALAMLTDSLHGLDIGWLFMLCAGICFLPGLRLLESKDLEKLPLGIVFFVAGCMTIGSAAQAIGIDTVVTDFVRVHFDDASSLKSVIMAFASGFGLTMSFTTLPAVSTLGPALAGIGLEAGESGKIILYAFLYGIDQFLMPYVFGPALYFYASGNISIKYYVLFQTVKLFLTVVFLLTIAIPWWSILI